MNIFTSGYEATTALTNVFILIFSIFCYFKIKNRRWKFFFQCMIMCSLLGSIAHGIIMSDQINRLIWLFLNIFFVVTTNTLLSIFVNLNMKHIITLSLIVTFVLIVEVFFNLNYVLTFTMYVLLIVLVIIFKIIRNGIHKHKWYFIGIMILLFGGILMLNKVSWGSLNHNGICHIFILITLICFYIGIVKDKKSNE